MKINIISDIHAIMENSNLCFTVPLKYTLKKYKQVFDTFYIYYNKNCEQIKKQTAESWFHFGNMNKIIEKIKLSHDNDYNNLNITSFEITDFINYISFLKTIGFDWSYKKRLIKSAIPNYMVFLQKTMFDFNINKLEPADYLIIAGDLGADNTYKEILNNIKLLVGNKFKDVLYVKGNHDYWNLAKVKENIKAHSVINTINLSDDKFELIDGDYVFLGCTMWSHIPILHKDYVSYYMNDYRNIPGFSVEQSNELFETYKKWLIDKVEEHKDKKIIIITHHGPFKEMIPRQFNTSRNDIINYAYTVKDDTFKNINKYNNIVLWASGHTHKFFDEVINNIRCIRNPIGYGDLYGFHFPENYSHTWYNTVIEV
jgi:predicted phosphodiesterase